MGENIETKFSNLNRAVENFNEIQKSLIRCQNELTAIENTLQRMDDSALNKTGHKLSNYHGKINEHSNTLRSFRSVLSEISTLYSKTEQDISGTSITKTKVNQNIPSYQNQSEDDNQFLKFVKFFLSVNDKAGYDDKSGTIKDLVSYLESLYKYFSGDKRGLTGARDWFHLGDKSISLWTGFYDYIKNYYNGIGNSFSLNNQKGVAGLGILAGIFGLASSAFGVAETAHSGEKGTAGIIGEIIDGGGNFVDIWGGIEKLSHVGDSASNITTAEGLYSPLSFYSAIAKGYLSATSQGFKSYEKYMADGKWNMDDTARTGVESSVSGLYSMANSLTFGALDASGVTSDDISSGLENWASDVGTGAGNYINNHPLLYNAYKKSGTIGQVLITYYAVNADAWERIL